MKSKHQQVKILLRYYSSLLDEETVETLWANVVDEAKGHYKIDNIPFYGPLLASDDIVWAEYDDVEQMLTYRETITSSGNSVIQVVILNESIEMDEIRNEFKGMGCPSEKFNEGYFVMEIPFNLDYKPIKGKLDQLRSKNFIDYAEPCLSKKHSSKK